MKLLRLILIFIRFVVVFYAVYFSGMLNSILANVLFSFVFLHFSLQGFTLKKCSKQLYYVIDSYYALDLDPTTTTTMVSGKSCQKLPMNLSTISNTPMSRYY